MSTSPNGSPQKSALPHDARVQVRQLLREREQKLQEHNTKTYVDEPSSVACSPDGNVVVVAMQSGRVWISMKDSDTNYRTHWSPLGAAPLPDTPARETYDELMAMNRELSRLGHVEED